MAQNETDSAWDSAIHNQKRAEAAEQRIAELEAENQRLANMKSFSHWADLKRDAERYRWLRDDAMPDQLSAVEGFLWEEPEELDAAIDEAMK